MRIERAIIFVHNGSIYFQANPDALLFQLTQDDLNLALHKDQIVRHLDGKPGREIYIFRTSGRQLLKTLKEKQQQWVEIMRSL